MIVMVLLTNNIIEGEDEEEGDEGEMNDDEFDKLGPEFAEYIKSLTDPDYIATPLCHKKEVWRGEKSEVTLVLVMVMIVVVMVMVTTIAIVMVAMMVLG